MNSFDLLETLQFNDQVSFYEYVDPITTIQTIAFFVSFVLFVVQFLASRMRCLSSKVWKVLLPFSTCDSGLVLVKGSKCTAIDRQTPFTWQHFSFP